MDDTNEQRREANASPNGDRRVARLSEGPRPKTYAELVQEIEVLTKDLDRSLERENDLRLQLQSRGETGPGAHQSTLFLRELASKCGLAYAANQNSAECHRAISDGLARLKASCADWEQTAAANEETAAKVQALNEELGRELAELREWKHRQALREDYGLQDEDEQRTALGCLRALVFIAGADGSQLDAADAFELLRKELEGPWLEPFNDEPSFPKELQEARSAATNLASALIDLDRLRNLERDVDANLPEQIKLAQDWNEVGV